MREREREREGERWTKNTCIWLLPVNGVFPVTSWNKIAPTLQRSACPFSPRLDVGNSSKRANESKNFNHHLRIIFLKLHNLRSHVKGWTTQGFCKSSRLQRSARRLKWTFIHNYLWEEAQVGWGVPVCETEHAWMKEKGVNK